ncbi:peptidoglycan-binding protein [Actinomadura nitritigenes]|uniref:peptidoglycan-binding protein n=1 Tax=Actinomadura nitritigenes TaxID=134602 RepID=UPI003D94B698
MSTTPTPAGQAKAEPPDRRARRLRATGRRGRAVAVVAVAVAAAGGIAIAATDPFGDRTDGSSIQSTARTGLAQITRGTLSARTQENGTLGYAGSHQVINKASGTVTMLPSVGKVIRQGRPLYKVDGKPVLLLYGTTPVYRALSLGAEGDDVRQLNAALVALGYATSAQIDTSSKYFGWQTYYALKELQDTAGLEESGDLPLGQAVFVPAKEVRVTKTAAVRGGTAAPGAAVLTVSSTERRVTVSLSAGQQSDVAAGDKVTITLPTGKSTPGVVSSVGKVATKSDTTTTVDVQITPSEPADTGTLDQAPVQVSIVSETVKDVLAVPVNALLALSGGGYAVEVVDAAGTHRLVGVKTGLFDDSAGRVEITGAGLGPGQNVVVPGT